MKSNKVLICFGTRPEAIKMAPVVREFSKRSNFDTKVCVTAQHRQMLDQVLEIFGITPDYDLDLMTAGQTLEHLTGAVIDGVSEVLKDAEPDCLIVQGDTTTTFAAAVAAFYRQTRVGHVEAGLRTYRKYAPFPEEMNRKMTSCITDFHFAPTQKARRSLLKENYPDDSIFVVGNTVIDALLSIVDKARSAGEHRQKDFPQIDWKKRILLVTGHRRENFGEGFLNICRALKEIGEKNPELEIIYPVHLNPNVQQPVNAILSDKTNIHLIEPQDYLTFVWLLDKCHIVVTDSGGVQEEAPSLGKPVLVMRETTERPEAVDAGVAKLVGTDKEMIVSEVQELLVDDSAYNSMSRAQNPYGDGTSAVQIADILEERLK